MKNFKKIILGTSLLLAIVGMTSCRDDDSSGGSPVKKCNTCGETFSQSYMVEHEPSCDGSPYVQPY